MIYWIVESPAGPMFHAVPSAIAARSSSIRKGPKGGVQVEEDEFLGRLQHAVEWGRDNQRFPPASAGG